eukprot:EG_transcript_16138
MGERGTSGKEGGRPLPHRRTRRGTAGPPRAGMAPTPGDGPPGGVAGLRDRSAAREGPRRAAADDFRRQGKRRSGANAGLSEAAQTPPTWRGRRVPTEGTSILLSLSPGKLWSTGSRASIISSVIYRKGKVFKEG